MAAITSAVIAGAGLLMAYEGNRQEKNAKVRAGKMNAADALRNARIAREQALQDEKMFRLSFRRDQAANVTSIAASGVKLEGSPLEVLQNNAALAEGDALRIRQGGDINVESYRRQARNFRAGGAAAGRAGEIQGAAILLQGAGSVYNTGTRSGAF